MWYTLLYFHCVSGLSKLQIVGMPVESNAASTVAATVGIVVGVVALTAIIIFAAVVKLRRRGGSHAFGADDLEYSKLVE
jgi:heme/copper-type cytochrome/quinol oxidase subunit 2